MRLSASAPVTWPDAAALDRWWDEQLATLARTGVGPDGVVVDPSARPGDPRVRLVAGTHLAPGASYVLEGPALGEAVTVGATVAGAPDRRTVDLVMTGRRRLLGPGTLVEARLDALDGLHLVTARSSHPYLDGSLRLTPEPDAPLDLTLRLRWLAADLHVDAAGGRLSARLDLTARGVWSPATGPLIALIGRALAGSVRDLVEQWAGDLTALAEGREPPSRVRERAKDQRREAARWSRERLRERLTQVQDELEGRWWWATRRSAWMAAYDALPPVAWPSAPTRDGSGRTDYGELARETADGVALTPRGERRAAIARAVETFAALDLLEPVRPERAEAPARPLTDEDLELRWLRSPLSTWRHLRRTGVVSEDTPPDLDEGAAESSPGPCAP